MKNVPSTLALNDVATTYCMLMRIECKGRFAGTVLGFTSLDSDIVYDDGAGAITYHASNGFTPEKMQADADFGVDNTDVVGWVTNTGITDQQIHAGIFDYAEVTIYRINYMQPTAHEVMGFGTLGQTIFDETSWRCEYRSLMQQAKQVQSTVYSLTCRATFGDSKCKMPFVWVSSTVTDESDEPNRLFFAATLTQPDNYFVPGVVEWLTGDNAGIQVEVEESFDNGAVRLALPVPFPIKPLDTFKIRRDCKKTFAACKAYGNELNFRGEHLTPIADVALSVPGGYIKQSGAE